MKSHATMKRILKAFSLFAMMMQLCGCQHLMEAVDRHGDYFYLTKNYGSSSVDFALFGKMLVHQDDGKFVLLPSPTAIFPGIPLVLIENYVICPVIDLVLVPTDMVRNFGSGDPEYIRSNGCYVQVMDVFGRPVPGVEVRVCNVNRNRMPVIYKGCRQRQLRARGLTDEFGELFIPVDMTTVDDKRLKDVSTAGKCSKGKYEMAHYEPGRHHPPFQAGHVDRFYRQLPRTDIENPDQLFPQRDEKRRIRVVLQPELTWPDGRTAQWSFIPEKREKISRAENRFWSLEKPAGYDNLSIMDEKHDESK